LGVLLALIGIPVLLVGAAAAVYVGPDDTVDLLDEFTTTDAPVISAGTTLWPVAGPTLHVTADGGDAETFIGLAHPVHLDSYLADIPQLRISDVNLRGKLTTDAVAGEPDALPAVPPAGLDWWQEQAVGTGEQTISFELTETPADIVIMRAEPAVPVDVVLSVAGEVRGLFVTAVAVAALGLFVIIGGLLLRRSGSRRRRRRRAARRSADPLVDDDDAPPDDPGRAMTARVVRVVGGAGVAALALSGCAQLPQRIDTADPPDPLVSATQQQAEQFLAEYTEVRNTALAAQDPEQLSTVESGTLLASSQFSIAAQVAHDEPPPEPSTVAADELVAPQLASYPMWFIAADAPDNESGGLGYYLMTRPDAATSWHAAIRVDVPAGVDPPLSEAADDVVSAADQATAEQGSAVLEALVGYAETGTAPEGVDVTAAGDLADLHQQGFAIAGLPAGAQAETRTCSLADPDAVHWLESDSGAVAMASITCIQTIELAGGAFMTTPADGYGTIPANTQITASSITQAVSFLVTVDDEGSATVVGGSIRPTAMSHTPR
ncbi:MAG TPA: hypothetical protein VFQ15_10490, partial [Jiangellaceae bacterium]|nr:hypothetical protein [Jiangellaceae bacterium]